MDPNLVNLSRLSPDVKKRIVDYVLNVRKVSPSELGYSPSYVYKVRSGKITPSDDFVRSCLRFISVEEYARLVGSDLARESLDDASLEDALRVVRKALRDRNYREYLLNLLYRYLGEYITARSQIYYVTESDLELFQKILKAQRRASDTITRHLRYLKRALAELNYTLSPEGIRELITELIEERGLNVARHTVNALKKFIKTVIMEKDPYLGQILYNSFRTIRPRPRIAKLDFTLEDLKHVWQELPSLESKLYFAILTECGLRPGEPFLIRIDNVDWELRVVFFEVEHVGETKRRYLTFLHESTVKWIRSEYLPYRDRFVRQYLPSFSQFRNDVNDWSLRLLPFDRDRLRKEIKTAFRKVLNKEIELYDLRKHWATWMSLKGVPGQIIDILQGRTPPKQFEVLMRHYVTIGGGGFLLELRKWFDSYAPRIIS